MLGADDSKTVYGELKLSEKLNAELAEAKEYIDVLKEDLENMTY